MALVSASLCAGCASGDEATALASDDAGPQVNANDPGDAGNAVTADAPWANDSAATQDPDAGLEPPPDAPGASLDAGVTDATVSIDAGQGVDSGALDAGTDAANDSGIDTGLDAATLDAGTPDAAPGPDGGLPISITNPIQVEVSSLLTIDTVGTSATNGLLALPSGTLTSMDGSGYDFYTATVATANSVSGGLPPNGIFYANGTHPDIDLHFDDSSTAPNSLELNGAAPNNAKSFSFVVPSFAYTQLQIYGTSAEGTSALSITFSYADTSTGTTSVTIPDWGTNAASGSVFVLAGSLGRLGSGIFEGHNGFALYGATLTPDSTRSLSSVTVTTSGSGRFVFYGATAW